MSLPHDVCRCVADNCPLKETCARWLEKGSGGYWTPFADLSPYMEDGECARRVPADDQASSSSSRNRAASAIESAKSSVLRRSRKS